MEIQMQRKFLELKQENMSIAEYEAKFTELSRFVPQLKATIAEAGSEMSQKMKQTKKRKFDGRSRSVGGESFPSKFVRGTASQSNRSTGFGGSGSLSVARSGNQTRMSYHSQPRPPLPECKSCGKKYSGQCMQKPVTCFKCGKVGHYATACNQEASKCFQCGKTGHMTKDYPAAAPASSRHSVAASNRVPTARTFNMTVKDAVRNTNIIAGTLLLNSNPANVLFDSGATKSFVSKEFAEKLDLKVEPLKESLQVEIANQEIIPVNQLYANCNLELGGVRYPVDLIPFRLGEFDVILGMDWLSRNHAHIDCKGKKVKLKTPSGKNIKIKGQRQTNKFLTIVQTKRLLRQGCEAYLAHVVDTKRETPEIHTIPVVIEFEDVFSKDLPGLPPDWEIEFAIDLAPGTTPANMVADALSRKERLKRFTTLEDLIREFEKLEIEVKVAEPGTEGLYEMVMQPELLEKIRRCQEIVLRENKELVCREEAKCEPDEKGIRRHAYRIWVPNVQELKDEILREGHITRYTVHPGSTKMYQDLKEYY
ncbi:uncharacterized protein LOC141695656 [Apium graveolens]|uniref:uncharacterized protein LOC141695656 n=1 Tax=Apium graveolens TaxID=4045 RepID=UPI003D7A61D1